jgi:site-specific DNA-methyltransferase (adenine-specific)
MVERLRLINGECLEEMKAIETESVDLILADLPYAMTSNKWDCLIDLEALWEQYTRITKPISAIVLTASQPFTSVLIMSNMNLFKHEWIWQKNRGSNFANTVREPMKEHESVLVFSKGKWTYNKQMQERAENGKSRVKSPVKFETGSDNYRQFDRVTTQMLPELRVPSSVQKFNTEVGLHPTQKPVPLFQYLVRTYSNVGGTVLDNTMGSGTTGVAALMEKRNFIGIERDEKYFEIAKNRIEKLIRPDDDIFQF